MGSVSTEMKVFVLRYLFQQPVSTEMKVFVVRKPDRKPVNDRPT